MSNAFARLIGLLPGDPLLVGTVTAIADGVATVELPDGGVLRARGAASVDDRVFVRAGAIEGQAPALSYVEIDV
jgi:hypothetical protein